MRTALHLLLVIVLCSSAAFASSVTVGVNSKVGPGRLATCQTIVDGVIELGSGTFGSLITVPVIADLADRQSATTVLHMDATNVPAGLCTTEGVAVTVATAACSAAYTVVGLRPIRDELDDIIAVLWSCQKLTTPTSPFWILAECPE